MKEAKKWLNTQELKELKWDIDEYIKYGKENGIDLHMLGFEENDQTTLETIEEYKRLFYVGYTRAQFVMLLPLYSKFGEGLSFV